MNNKETNMTPGKRIRRSAALVLLAAFLLGSGMAPAARAAEETAPAEETVAYTVPADGNPEDETAKGTYTADDAAVLAVSDTVVATCGDAVLTNGQLQVYYWMEVQSFLSSYGSYISYFGLDVSQGLDTQVCAIAGNGETWQQFFLASALNTWKNYQALATEAELAGFQMDEQMQAELENIPANMEQNALMYGFNSVEELLAYNVGGAATVDDYMHYMHLYYPGTLYYNSLVEANTPTEAEVEAYFNENEQAYLDSGLSREDKYVDVRHVLIMPEGADSSNIRTETFDEAAWASAKAKAEELLAQWEQGDKSEDSFAQLAMDHSQDGSASTGGLYTDVTKGQMVENFENWCFDESRQHGDYGIVETEFGYHLMFFVGSRPLWVEYAESDLVNARSAEVLNGIISRYTLEAEFDRILLAYVDIDGESEAEAETPAQSGETQSQQEQTGIRYEETQIQAEPVLNESNKPVLLIAAASLAALAVAVYVFDKKEQE
ncbi:MAG: peptidylprolyl isomerase [Oscillospiraceae bacterium]|nr:peptidylprolyl isomerase [Oscillospiraceae bacterium]